jgi:hypothetical protein
VVENQRVRPSFSKNVFLPIVLIYILNRNQNVKKAVKDAQAELKRHQGLSNTQRRRSDLKNFGNRDHQLQLPGAAGPNSLPKVGKKRLMEFPLKNGGEAAGEKGPARVIVKKISSADSSSRALSLMIRTECKGLLGTTTTSRSRVEIDKKRNNCRRMYCWW